MTGTTVGFSNYTPNSTFNSLPVPEKGMIESLFGGAEKSGTPAQELAALVGPNAGAEKADPTQFHGSLEEYIKQMMQNQDQKDAAAKQIAGQTKGEMQKAMATSEKSGGKAGKESQDAAAVAAAVAAAIAEKAKADALHPELNAQANAQMSAHMSALIAAQMAAAKAPVSSAADPKEAAEAQRLQALLSKSPQAASGGNGVIQAPGSAVVAQPMVVAVPQPAVSVVPMPVEVLEAEDAEKAVAIVRPQASNAMVFSQDFVEGHGGQILGVNRPDPRLVGRGKVSDEAKEELGGHAELGMMLPQVGNHLTGKGMELTAVPVAATNVEAARTSSSKVDITNSMAIAAQVQNLAASGGGKIRVKVMPEELGEITISVQQGRDRKLDVKFEATSIDAKEALANAMPELRQALTASRYDVGRLEVGTSQSASLAKAWVSPMGDSSGLAQWSGFSQSEYRQGDPQGGSAWERYQTQQENRENHANGRQQSSYRRYREAEEQSA